MKTLTILFSIVLLFTVNAFSQTFSPDIKVDGVSLGDSYRQVVRKLGKPSRDYTVEADECVGGKSRFLIYKGLTVEMHPHSSEPKSFYVGEIEVTSARWNISGMRIGASLAAIRKKYKDYSDLQNGDKEGEKFLSVPIESTGNLYFHFRRGKLFKVETYYIC